MSGRSMPSRRTLAFLALAAIVLAGGYLRLNDLGAVDLTLEELNHHYVGQALATGDDPVLPSGYWYTRGVEYSRLTEFAGRFIDSPEVATRLPSALFGTAALGVMAAGTWAIAGPTAAVGATVLLAVYPEAVLQSRTGRFYMLQFLFGLIALFAGWLVVRPGSNKAARPRGTGEAPTGQGSFWRSRWARALGAAVAVVMFALAARLQVTTLPSVLALWLAIAVSGGLAISRHGSRAWRRSLPLQLAVATGLAGLVVLVARPQLAIAMTIRAASTPYWARSTQESTGYYIDILTTYFPMIGVVGVASFAYLTLKRPRLGGYLLVMFAVPMLIMSFALPFKADRFMLLAIPPLFIAIGAAVSKASTAMRMRRGVAGFWGRETPAGDESPRHLVSARFPMRAAAGVVAALPLFVALPTAGMLWFGYENLPSADWSAASSIVAARADIDGLPIGATRSLAADFYWGAVDFSVTIGHLEQWDNAALSSIASAESPGGAYVMSPQGTPDIYMGVPVLPSPDGIRSRFTSHEGVVIAIDGPSVEGEMVDRALLATLATEAEEICQGQCGSLEVYIWRFGDAAWKPSSTATTRGAVAGGQPERSDS